MSDLHLNFYPRPTGDACQHEPFHDSPAVTPTQRTNIIPPELNDKERPPSPCSSVSLIPTPEGVSNRPRYVRCRSRMEDYEPSLTFV
jgi:hypothetical protein